MCKKNSTRLPASEDISEQETVSEAIPTWLAAMLHRQEETQKRQEEAHTKQLQAMRELLTTLRTTRYRALHARMSHRTGASKTCLYISNHRK